ncbi:MAG: acyltransferase [Terrimicrobiaceae bacterium]|nr:acyltransferase [Terrimicrobiaceae bacterium]
MKKIIRGILRIRAHVILGRAGVKYGAKPLFPTWISPRFYNHGAITIGDHLRIDSFFDPVRIVCEQGASVEIGSHVYINTGTHIQAVERISIGDHAKIGPNVYICDSGFHEIDAETPARADPIRLGKNTWLGRNCMVLPGVTIGDHSIVASHAVVSKDVPPKSICAGVPATVIRTLNCPDDWIRA